MTDTPDAHVVRLTPPHHRAAGDHPSMHQVPASPLPSQTWLDELPESAVERIDGNFVRIDAALAEIRGRIRWPWNRRASKSAAAARVNPDRFWFGMVIAGLNGVFILGAFVVQFGGQYGFAPRTQLPPGLWWFIPLALDLPIVVSSFTAAVYRRRKQEDRAKRNWQFVVALTILASIIQVIHVLDAATGGLALETILTALAALGPAGWLGALVMGLIPWIVLYLSENLAGLLVKPYGETREAVEPAPTTPARTPRRTTKKVSTKR